MRDIDKTWYVLLKTFMEQMKKNLDGTYQSKKIMG